MVKVEEMIARAQRPIVILTFVNTVLLSIGAFMIMNAALTECLNEKEELLVCNLASVVAEPMSLGKIDRCVTILKLAKEQDKDMCDAAIVSPDGLVIAATEERLKNTKLSQSGYDQMTSAHQFRQSRRGEGILEARVAIMGTQEPRGTRVQLGVLSVGYSDQRVVQVIWCAEIFIFCLGILNLGLLIVMLRRVLRTLIVEPPMGTASKAPQLTGVQNPESPLLEKQEAPNEINLLLREILEELKKGKSNT